MDNPFARFGVEHLSATSMNQFRADPALGILYLVYKIREQGSPAMHRGSAVDETIGALLSDEPSMDKSSACDLATRTYDALINKTDEVYAQHTIAKERDVVIACMQRCYPIMNDWDKPLSYQQPINLSLQGIEIPIIGYIDLCYPGEVRELKTFPASGVAVSLTIMLSRSAPMQWLFDRKLVSGHRLYSTTFVQRGWNPSS
ncbi:MAG: hypothetical protein Ct9H300mP14_04820 [Gammaproteobacteria bacterium]|nr:MAG: hypothetical protein Ct9H300mP14_04820 [Gammaproteobacteria bacterium]